MSDLTLDLDALDAAATALIERLLTEPHDLINLCMMTSVATCRERIAELRLRQRQGAAASPQQQARRFRR